MTTLRIALAGAILATGSVLPVPASAGLFDDLTVRSGPVDCEALAERLRRRRDDRVLNPQDYLRLRQRGC